MIPHECDGLGAPTLLAVTSACIQKRPGLVPTALVISFELLICFGPFITWRRTLDETPDVLVPHQRDGSRPSFLFAGTSACIQKRSGLVLTVSVTSFGLLILFWSTRIIAKQEWCDPRY